MAIVPASRRRPRGVVLVVEEQALIERSDVGEVVAPHQHGTTTPRKHVGRLVVLAPVRLEEAAVAAEAVLVQGRSGVVDDVE